MALKAILSQEEFDSLNEVVKPEYKQDGDTYTLDVTAVNGMALEDVTGLKTALSTERTQRSSAEKLLKAFGAVEVKDASGKVTGFDFGELKPDEVRTKLARLVELEAIDPTKEAGKLAEKQVAAMKETLLASHKEELGKRDARVTTLEGYLYGALVENAIKTALGDGEVKGNYDLLEGIMKRHVKLTEEDDKFVVQVVDENGVPKVNSKADAMSVKELALELRGDKRFQGAFEGTGHTGGGHHQDGDKPPKPGDDSGGTGAARIRRGLSDPAQVRGASKLPPGLVPGSQQS